MAINIPIANTGSLSIVCESTPSGEVQLNPTDGLSVKPFASIENEMIIRVIAGHLYSIRCRRGEMIYRIKIVGMNQRSKLAIDHQPIFRSSFNIASDEPNNRNTIYLTVPHNMQLGMILLNLRLK
jgi:hypothetical protein